MKPYSKDLGLKVLEALDRGMPRREVAQIFGVSMPTIKRWLKRRRETGEIVPRPSPGPPARKGMALEEALPSQLRANSDFTLEEHRELFEETYGISVSTASVSRAFERLGLPLKKKTLCASECDEEERRRWREQVGQIDPQRLVFVDECGTHTSMTRRYGRAPRGHRAYASVPRSRGKNTTLLASMSLEGMGEAIVVEGSTTQKVFEAYVERFLAPTLKPGQVLILDNLGAHKGEKVRELIESRAASVIFLPAYSPDFNPIEEAFSKIKAILKKMAARTREALIEAIGRALEAIASQDVWGWFSHCGHVEEDQPS